MTTALEDVARELGALVRRLKGLHAEVTAAADVRLEMPAFGVLVTLELEGPSRPSSLADALNLDLSTVSRQLSALEREGRVLRERDPADHRAQIVEISPAGREALAQIRRARIERLSGRLPNWSQDELAAFAAQLARFTADISQPHPDSRDATQTRSLALAATGPEAR